MNDVRTITTSTAPTAFQALLCADQAALDAIPAGLYVCAANGEIVRYNRRAAELWGRAPRPGDSDERFCGAARLYHLDGRLLPHASTPMEAALRTGESQRDKEVMIERPDGSRAVVRVNIEALTGPDGLVQGAINCFHDVTAEQSAFRLAAIVDSSDDAITGKDLGGILTSWNRGAERLYGYTAEEVLGRHITVLVPESLLTEEDEILSRIRRGECTEHYETVRRRKDGSLIDVSITVSPVVDARGTVTGASTIARDITQRKADEAALARGIREQAALYAFVDRLQRTRSQAEICDAALDAILRALDCSRASILLFDEAGIMRFVAWRGLSEGYRQALDGHSPWKPGERNARPVLVENIDLADEPDSIKATVKNEGIRGLAFIPIMANGVVIGKIMTSYPSPHAFPEHEVELALTISRQLGSSLERTAAERAREFAVEKMRRNEERLRMATRAGKVGLWERNMETGRSVWTDSLYAIYGIEKTGPYMSLATVEALAHPEDRPRLTEAARRAVEEDAPYELEFRAVRPDGRLIWLFVNAAVVRDDRGVHVAGVTFDITDRKLAEERFRLAVEAAPSGMVLTDSAGKILLVNAHLERLLGYGRDELIGTNIETLVPERFRGDNPVFHEAYGDRPTARPMGTGREHCVRCKDGSELPVEIGLSPIQTNEGLMVLSAIVDISERKRAEAQRELLLAELNHRIKNTLAIVQGIAQQTFRNAHASPEGLRAFEGRLVNLAAAHSLLTEGNWQTAALDELAADALQVAAHESRISLVGPRVLLGPKQALAIVIALHELYTNAVKYGALSNETGTVGFTWRTTDGQDARLRMEWHEQGGPQVSAPTRRGFGSRMIEQALAQDLDARVTMDFRPGGLVCTIDAPLQDIGKDQE